MKKIFLIVCLCTSILFQAGAVSKTVSVTAGGLYAALTASEKTTITDLTVTGTLDARDLKTMRDNLTSLTKLNMSGATILAYTGKLGTDTISTTYPANEMPKNLSLIHISEPTRPY
jgi:hypothetical protein